MFLNKLINFEVNHNVLSDEYIWHRETMLKVLYTLNSFERYSKYTPSNNEFNTNNNSQILFAKVRKKTLEFHDL